MPFWKHSDSSDSSPVAATPSGRYVQVTINIPEATYNRIEQIALRQGVQVPDAIQQALATYSMIDATLQHDGTFYVRQPSGQMRAVVLDKPAVGADMRGFGAAIAAPVGTYSRSGRFATGTTMAEVAREGWVPSVPDPALQPGAVFQVLADGSIQRVSG